MISSPKKLLLSFLTFTLLLSSSLALLPTSTHASPAPIPTGPWYNPSLDQFRSRVIGAPASEIFGERYTFAQVMWIVRTIQLQFIPNIEDQAVRDQILKLLGNNSTPSLADFTSLGFPGLMAGTLSQMYAQPLASARTEADRALASFDLASPVFAQGYGFGATQAIRPLWIAARNTAYFVMVILLIASGFLIMFRIKINPQTAVNLQLMIPKIIITLVAVTFSYAIAGLIIDLVYVVVGLTIFLLSTAASNVLVNTNAALNFFLQPSFTAFFMMYLVVWLTLILSQLISMDILGALVSLVLTIVIFFLLFRVWWMMLKTYINLILSIIIGPWQIMLGLLPNNNGFGAWLRNLIAHASVFVVVPLMFLLSITLLPNVQSQNPILGWLTNLIGNYIIGTVTGLLTGVDPVALAGQPMPEFPLFGARGDFFRYAIVFGILAIIPKTAEMVRDALKVPAFKYGSAFGEAMGPVTGIVGGTLAGKGAFISKGGASWSEQALGGALQTIGGRIQKT